MKLKIISTHSNEERENNNNNKKEKKEINIKESFPNPDRTPHCPSASTKRTECMDKGQKWRRQRQERERKKKRSYLITEIKWKWSKKKEKRNEREKKQNENESERKKERRKKNGKLYNQENAQAHIVNQSENVIFLYFII